MRENKTKRKRIKLKMNKEKNNTLLQILIIKCYNIKYNYVFRTKFNYNMFEYIVIIKLLFYYVVYFFTCFSIIIKKKIMWFSIF